MIKITDDNRENCCGCTACINICPVNAINMKEDKEGFLYPVVNNKKCINCGLCDKVCPIKNPLKANKEPNAYCIRNKNEDILKESTSGGAFTAIAEYIIENQGIVIGAGYDENLEVKQKRKKKKSELNKLRGSKYVQSNLINIYKEIKEKLEEKNLILFTGTPCQVQGLEKYLNKNYENLITMDFVCHGVPSPKLWKKYIEYQENNNKAKIKNAYFRNKTYGYHSSTMKLKFQNNKVYYGSLRVDYMLRCFFAEIASRPSCYSCKFKNKQHISDITVFDCWHAKNLVLGLQDDNKGYTTLLVNTIKGKRIFDNIQQKIYKYDVDLEKAIELDGIMMENSAIPNKNRNIFYQELDDIGLEKTVKKYINVSIKDKIIESSKKFLYNTKLLEKIKKMLKK